MTFATDDPGNIENIETMEEVEKTGRPVGASSTGYLVPSTQRNQKNSDSIGENGHHGYSCSQGNFLLQKETGAGDTDEIKNK